MVCAHSPFFLGFKDLKWDIVSNSLDNYGCPSDFNLPLILEADWHMKHLECFGFVEAEATNQLADGRDRSSRSRMQAKSLAGSMGLTR